MPDVLIHIDLTKPPQEQPLPLHNRWHPEIPPVATVKPGDVFRVECVDWTGGQIGDNDSANDIRDVDLAQVHYLSGPIAVEGAEPGDLLVVDILDIGALPDSEWGFTGIFARENGGGFLTDHYPDASKAIWHFQGVYAVSRHIPGVRFAGLTHPGLIGCAPSADLLATWNRRESALLATDPDRVPPSSLHPPPRAPSWDNFRGHRRSGWPKRRRAQYRRIPSRFNDDGFYGVVLFFALVASWSVRSALSNAVVLRAHCSK